VGEKGRGKGKEKEKRKEERKIRIKEARQIETNKTENKTTFLMSKFLPCSGEEWISLHWIIPSNFWSSGFSLQFSCAPSRCCPSSTM
jgi:hypothetical protein